MRIVGNSIGRLRSFGMVRFRVGLSDFGGEIAARLGLSWIGSGRLLEESR